MFVDAEFENVDYYAHITKKDGSLFDLYGTSYKVPVVFGTSEKDSNTFVYMAKNESGTWSYGEAAYDDCLVSV